MFTSSKAVLARGKGNQVERIGFSLLWTSSVTSKLLQSSAPVVSRVPSANISLLCFMSLFFSGVTTFWPLQERTDYNVDLRLDLESSDCVSSMEQVKNVISLALDFTFSSPL